MTARPHPPEHIGWELIEKVVALLEHSLQPFAKVEHNVKLPVLGKSRRRQCDVVITAGEYPRQTISIVEVQKRNRKPDINTFHGWYRKMQEVGAQHLICVSVLGYPQSIIDEVALQYGPTVKLLTLKQLQDARLTNFNFVLPFIFQKTPRVQVMDIGDVVVKAPSPTQELPHMETIRIDARDKIFTIADSTTPISLTDLAAEYLDKTMVNYFKEKEMLYPESYTVNITLGSIAQDLWIHRGHLRFKLHQLPLTIGVRTEITRVPITMFEYQQQFVEDTLRWVAVGRCIVNGADADVRIVFQANAEGFLQIVTGLSDGVYDMEFDFSPDPTLMKTYLELSATPEILDTPAPPYTEA